MFISGNGRNSRRCGQKNIGILHLHKGGNNLKSFHYPVLVEQDSDGVFIVECPVFDGCRSYGDTLDNAMANIREAIALCQDEQDVCDSGTTFLGIRDVEMVV